MKIVKPHLRYILDWCGFSHGVFCMRVCALKATLIQKENCVSLCRRVAHYGKVSRESIKEHTNLPARASPN